MIPDQFDALTKALPPATRRNTVRLLAGAPLAGLLATLLPALESVHAKRGSRGHGKRPRNGLRKRGGTGKHTGGAGRNKKTCDTCCRADGSACTRKSKNCKPGFCQGARSASPPSKPTGYSIAAHWTDPVPDYDTFLFVPNAAGSADPSPYIDYSCTPDSSQCENDVYPFACVSEDSIGPGDEIATVWRLIAGQYEYWIAMGGFTSPPGNLTVNLRDDSGTLLRSWSSPEILETDDGTNWHVLNIDGETGAVTSIDRTLSGLIPEAAHRDYTNVCPYD